MGGYLLFAEVMSVHSVLSAQLTLV